MPYYYGLDWTYILVLIGAVLSMIASSKVKTTYAKYGNVGSHRGMTAMEAARRILDNAGLSNVDAILEEYGYVEKENTDLIVLFVVDGYPNVETPTEVSTVRILKEKYPNLKVNSVQLDLNNKNVPEVSASGGKYL